MSTPSLVEQLRNLSRDMLKWRKAGFAVASEEHQAARIAICAECDHITPNGRCSECGCNMAWKTWIATAQCPLNHPKWVAIAPGPIQGGKREQPQEENYRWYFQDPKNARRLRAELVSWIGTRFFDSAAPAKKQVKADCVSFVEAALVNVGAIKPIAWPRYVTHSGGESMLNLLLQTLRAMPELAELPRDEEKLPGDILVYSSGKALHHLAFFSNNNTLWHATKDGGGVCTGNANDPVLNKRLIAIFRVKA